MTARADNLKSLNAVAALLNEGKYDEAGALLQRLTNEQDETVLDKPMVVSHLWGRIKTRGRNLRLESTAGVCGNCAHWGSLDPAARIATCRSRMTSLPLADDGVLTEGGVLATAPRFGCVHWGAKED